MKEVKAETLIEVHSAENPVKLDASIISANYCYQ